MAKTVKMERDGKSADVHPDEVDGMEKAGWAKAAQKAKKQEADK
jgi:hypothetical protein